MCTLPWVFAKLQSGGRSSAARRERPPAFASRVCASRGDEGGEVCSHPSARASPSTSPDGNPAIAGGLGTPPLAGVGWQEHSSILFQQHCFYRVGGPAALRGPQGCRRKETLACMSPCLLGPQHPGLITLPSSVLSSLLYCFSSALIMLI